MVYGRPSKAFSCSYAAWLKPNALAKTGETDSCSPSLCLKAISGSQSLGELFKAHSWGWGRPLSGRNVPSGHQATNAAVSFIKTRSFRMTKAHTLSWELEVTQCWKAQDSHSCSQQREFTALFWQEGQTYTVCVLCRYFSGNVKRGFWSSLHSTQTLSCGFCLACLLHLLEWNRRGSLIMGGLVIRLKEFPGLNLNCSFSVWSLDLLSQAAQNSLGVAFSPWCSKVDLPSRSSCS